MTGTRAIIAVLLCLQAVSAQEFPVLVRNCREKHLDRLNECFVSAIKRIQPRLADGIPSLNMPALEPLLLDDILFTQSEGSVSVNAVYKNVMVTGASMFDLKYFDWFFEENKMYMGMTFPMMIMRGQYNISGNIFQLPVEGTGDFMTMMDGIVAQSEADLQTQPDGSVLLANMKIDFNIKRVKSQLMNLFNGNQLLSDTFHHFANNNDQLILDEIRPEISRQLNHYMKNLLQSLISSLPTELLSGLSNSNARDKHRQRTLENRSASNKI
ncbi:hemolymph juvenile hormone binding [Trinorchestia longiramus]|nr:hemolymph juvenile hormone binding [Trinorchestia longiramus]